MGSILKIMNSAPVTHVAPTISDRALKNVPDSAKLHGMHKPYQCDFASNRNKLAENTPSLMKED